MAGVRQERREGALYSHNSLIPPKSIEHSYQPVINLQYNHVQIGSVEVNLAEFAGGGAAHQFYLLHAVDSRHLDNSILKVCDWLSCVI